MLSLSLTNLLIPKEVNTHLTLPLEIRVSLCCHVSWVPPSLEAPHLLVGSWVLLVPSHVGTFWQCPCWLCSVFAGELQFWQMLGSPNWSFFQSHLGGGFQKVAALTKTFYLKKDWEKWQLLSENPSRLYGFRQMLHSKHYKLWTSVEGGIAFV